HNHTFAPTPRCAVGEPALPRRQISWWQTLTDSPRNLTCSPAFPTGSPPPSNPCVAKDASPKRISRRPSNRSAAPCWMRTWQCPRCGPSPPVRERASSAEVSQALNPGQQVVKIVHEQLIEILGGDSREVSFAKYPPTVIMLAGLQGAGKTTLAGKLGRWLKEQGHTPMLVAADLQRPNAVTQLQVVGEKAGVPVWAPEPGNGVGDPVATARSGVDQAREKYHDVVVVD